MGSFILDLLLIIFVGMIIIYIVMFILEWLLIPVYVVLQFIGSILMKYEKWSDRKNKKNNG